MTNENQYGGRVSFKSRQHQETFALFILASNNVLKSTMGYFKEYPFLLKGYCPIKRAKDFSFQWNDR